ncbi:MAG: TetR/AcrR family transcriptional regulator [Kiritimatiellae bacterium]|nr:TetR/AcrR family transcriptional regulator [Kiritimatiellia bacterium]
MRAALSPRAPSRRSAGRPQRLAEAAFLLFAERGFDGATLDEVAAAAGVTKGSLYCHFENKLDLMLAACRHYYRCWEAGIHTAIATARTPAERLRRALVFSVASCVADHRNRRFTTGIFMRMQHDAAIRSSWAQFYASVREFYIGLVRAAQAAGELPPGDARRQVDLMLEAMEGLKVRAGFEPAVAEPSEQAATVDALYGIFARPTEERPPT